MEAYRNFCRDSKCIHYNLIERLESIENPEEEIERDLSLAKNRCEHRCERTAHDFYAYLKNEGKI